MPNLVGFVDNGAPHNAAHKNLLKAVHDWVLAEGHVIERYETSGTDHQLIVRSPGLSGTEQIYWGFRTYESAASDFYNFFGMVATGYIAANHFDVQPNASYFGVCGHNNRIDYWLTLNGQRIAGALKVGTPVYEHFYMGKFLPYARPSQYPYPVLSGGTLDPAAASVRFSDTTHSFYLRGAHNRGRIRTPGGWVQGHFWPWRPDNTVVGSTYILRDVGGHYPLLPVIVHDGSANIYGELDGIFMISGFNNAVENTVTIGGTTYVVMQDVYRTGHGDYYALRLDP